MAGFAGLNKRVLVWATSRWMGLEERKIGLYAYCRLSSRIGAVNNFCPS